MAEAHARIEPEDVSSVFRSERRERTIRALANLSTETTRDELARALARTDARGVSSEDIAVSLYHVHLPKLADVDAIRYGSDGETVAITEKGRRILRRASDVGLTGPE